MLFNSFTFIVFFAIVFLLFYILPHKLRWLLLLVASLTFYMWWKAELIILILISTLTNYSAALLINKSEQKNRKKLYLTVALFINFSLLFIFKYAVFGNSLVSQILGRPFVENLNIILPMGISFYTFQAAAYVIDVYKNKIEIQRNYLKFLLFIIFFPQLVAGPIERAENLMPQLFSTKEFDFSGIKLGLKIALWGFFKKVVIADRAALFVNGVFNSVQYYNFPAYTIAAFLFAFQIYCDFSGYSDIAIGCSKMLGINLMDNFNHPYFAHSLKDHWRRWHISLSTWFKDYLYFPLGGNRVSKPRYYLNLLVTFTVSGLWHGANTTYVLWGVLHGLFQIIGSVKADIMKKILPEKDYKDRNPVSKIFSIIVTFIMICFLFIFFRANSVNDAFYMLSHFFWGFKDTLTAQGFYTSITTLPASLFELIIVLLAIVFLMTIEFAEGIAEGNVSIHVILNKKPVILRFLFYFFVITAVFALGVFTGAEQFIYFQF